MAHTAPRPEDARRLAALRACRILDTPPDPAFDAIVARAARESGAAYAMIALHDEDRLWFKAHAGFAASNTDTVNLIALDTMATDGILWVSDLARRDRYADVRWVKSAPHIRFYAGAPLRLGTGETIGFLCVVGLEPRRRSARLVREIAELAAIAAALIDARRLGVLKEESDQLRILAEAEAGVGFWRIDRTAGEGWWSPGVYSIFGRDPALGPALPADYREIAPPGTWEGWKDFMRRATTTRESFVIRLPFQRGEGRLKHLKIVCTADAGATDVSHGIIVDETASVNAIERSAAAQRLLSSFIENAPAALAMVDTQMRYLHASPQWRADYGLGDIDLIGRSHYEIFPEIGEDWKSIHRRCLAGETDTCARATFTRADGSIQYISWEVRPWRDAEGRIGGIMMMTRDLTREVETVLALERTSDRLTQALEIGRAFMWEFDDAAGALFVNGEAHAALGFPMPNATRAQEVFSIVHPEDAPAAIAMWKRHVKEGAPYRIEHRVGGADSAEERWVLAVSEAKRGPDGRVIGAVGLIQDITARKIAEHGLAAARDAAEAANRSKSEFLATVGHEIRTPLNGVLGMTHALARTDLTGEQRTLIGAILESGDTLLGLLNDLLDSARIEAGQLTLSDAPFDMDELLRGVAAMNRERASAKGLKLEIDVSAPLGAFNGDALRVKQVLLNLVGNAVKFTETGAVRIRAAREAFGPTQERVTFRVVDTGPGFDAETRARLFRRFSQADAQTTTRFGGSGLGLSICRGLVELMGGEIDCAASPGGGAEFWFSLTLPRADARPRRPAIAPASGDGLRVLCAEDHPINRKVVDLLLSAFGCATAFAADGQETVALWEAQEFDVILMDLHMPVMSGEEATRAIRAREAQTGRARTPIVAVTANAAPQQVEDCRAAGMDGHIAKPFRPEQLMAAIREAIARPVPAAPAALKDAGAPGV